jgi:predicted nucleic acid-binding protein
MDVCCLNRPFDQQSQQRIRLETEAILEILQWCQSGKYILVSSTALESEISQNPNVSKAEQVKQSLSIAQEHISVSSTIIERGKQLTTLGFKNYDALHLACAESARVDVFLTTDDRLLKKASTYKDSLKITASNPVLWLMSL